MNIIEQAARRLEELQRAGVEVPWAAAGVQPAAEPKPAPLAPVPAVVSPVRPDATPAAVSPPAPIAEPETKPVRQSRKVEIDSARLVAMGYAVPGAGRRLLADELRVIKRPLLRNAALKGEAALNRGNLIQVTSAMPGEGKTFTAINLAMSISMEVDLSVLLVDADVLRPAVLERLGVQADAGLMDVLRDPTLDLADVMLQTNIPKLSLLPAGRAGLNNSTELLASASMEALLTSMAERYPERIIIFDAPPLLAATEARVLASRMGQVVVVVAAGSTPSDVVSEAFATVANCPVVLPILNKYDGPITTSPYGY